MGNDTYFAGPRTQNSPAQGAAEEARVRRGRQARPGRRDTSVAVVDEVPAGREDKRARDRGARKRKQAKKRSLSASSEEEEYRSRKRQKTARRKKARTPSGSSSESGSPTSGDGSGTSSSDSSDSSPSSNGNLKGSKAGKRRSKQGKWGMLNDIWPLEMRPRKLQDRSYVEQQSWRTLNALQDRYEKEAERKGVGAAIFGKDRKLRKVTFKRESDDGFAKLHRARFLRLPLAAPEKYWKRVPKCHEQRFRHVQLSHYGAESQINEKVILAMHDRQVRIQRVKV